MNSNCHPSQYVQCHDLAVSVQNAFFFLFFFLLEFAGDTRSRDSNLMNNAERVMTADETLCE